MSVELYLCGNAVETQLAALKGLVDTLVGPGDGASAHAVPCVPSGDGWSAVSRPVRPMAKSMRIEVPKKGLWEVVWVVRCKSDSKGSLRLADGRTTVVRNSGIDVGWSEPAYAEVRMRCPGDLLPGTVELHVQGCGDVIVHESRLEVKAL